MFRFNYLLLGIASFIAPAPGFTQEETTYLRFEPTAIVDHAGLGRPTAAITLFVPQGWQTQGGIVWGNEYQCTNGYAVRWQAIATDGLSGALVFPQVGWEFNSNNGPVVNINCNKAQIYTVESYLRLLISDVRSDAQNITFNPRPDLLAEFAQSQSQKMWAMGIQQTWIETGELVFTFTEQGVEMTGKLAAAVKFEKTITNTTAYQAEAVQAWALPAFGTFARRGHYNPALFRAIRKSMIPDAYWSQEIAKHNAIMNGITLKGISDRGKIAADANREISNIIHNSWQRQQVNSDRRAREFLEVIRETETFDDASAPGGQIEFSSHYNQAWKLEDGTYVLTDKPGFNPVQELGISGTQLQVSQ